MGLVCHFQLQSGLILGYQVLSHGFYPRKLCLNREALLLNAIVATNTCLVATD